MKEIILCKYGEIVLKGANRPYFESLLTKEIKYRLRSYGKFNIWHKQSTLYVKPQDDFCDIDSAFEALKRVFGIAALCRCAIAEKNMDSILETIKEYIPEQMTDVKTFKVEAKRSDKYFPLKSPEISAIAGGKILECCPYLRVNVKEPDVTVKVEIREENAYIHARQVKGAGGMPVGSNGTGMLLLSGGIDSPVAGHMLAKRGVKIEAVHFESFPYTSERAKEKVLELASIMTDYTGSMRVHVVSLTKIQEAIARECEEDYFTLLLRRFMMECAQRIALENDCGALITGESVGQVASQTIQAINVTDNIARIPVFRPCIGLDKEEIVEIARKIGTFETSILPFEDCCTVFTPRHPKTRPELEKVLAEESKLDFDALVTEALETKELINVKYRGI
jgi:thiamine biosynthesis protein ThiI